MSGAVQGADKTEDQDKQQLCPFQANSLVGEAD